MRFFSILIVVLVSASPATADVTADASSVIEAMMTTLERGETLELDGEIVLTRKVVCQFYADIGNSPAWTNPASVGRMLDALDDIHNDGLDPQDYHAQALKNLGANDLDDPRELAIRDILLTDALHAMLYHLVFGKADPNSLDADWNIDDLYDQLDPMADEVRQQPGSKNALGQVKFMFPNKHAVYLHDTPSRYNFGRSARAFSSGCIRVENPLELAALLLDDQSGWDPDKIDQVIKGGKRTTVRLSKSLPVLLLYWTAFMGLDGNINFRDDLYGRDAAVLKALDAPPAPHTRHVR